MWQVPSEVRRAGVRQAVTALENLNRLKVYTEEDRQRGKREPTVQFRTHLQDRRNGFAISGIAKGQVRVVPSAARRGEWS